MDKNTKLVLALSGMGLIGYAFWRYITIQKDLLSKFTYSLLNIKFSHISMDDITANIVVRFNSIADVEVKVKKFYVDFYLNNIYVGNFEDNGEFTIIANGYADIPVTLKFNPQLIFTNIVDLSLVAININDVAISARGYADVSSSFISATIPISYDSSVKQLLSE